MSQKSNKVTAAVNVTNKSDAILEMPYKLLISMVVLSLTVPLILDGTDKVWESSQEKELEMQCTILADNAVLVYQQGSGSEKAVLLKLPKLTKFISVGGNFEEDAHSKLVSIRFCTISGGVQKTYARIGGSFIHLCSSLNRSYDIDGGGSREVRLKKCSTHIDLNSDGIIPDFYIELSNN